MPRAYVHIQEGTRERMGRDAMVSLKEAKGAQIKDKGALKAAGKGAGIGASVGSAVPIPGVGTAVGTVVGGAIGVGSSLFGGDPTETELHNVLPVVLKKVFDAKGARGTFAHPHNDNRGKGGLKLTGKAFKKERVLKIVKQVNKQIGKNASTHTQGDAQRWNNDLRVTEYPPSNRHQIIVSFPTPVQTPEATKQAQSTNPSSPHGNSRLAVYGIGAAAILFYVTSQ